MDLTSEYLAEQKDCIERNFNGYERNINDPVTLKRLQNLISFYMNFAPDRCKTISIGSGGFEAHYIGSTHACDVDSISYTLLKSLGWDGIFIVCSCDKIPYDNRYFKAAVCSEVIEHLPSKEIVRATFLELDRVAQHWLVTTPTRDVKEPTHKFIFTEQDLRELTAGLNVQIEKQGLFFYIHDGERKIFT